MKIWITGIAGFLGSHLAKRFLRDGHEVAGNDSFVCGSQANIPPSAYFEIADCCDFDAMNRHFAFFRPDIVYHCAATAHEGFSVFSPSFITRNIYEASVATFAAAINNRVKRIVYCSSMSRYGGQKPPFIEAMTPAPVDPYGIAKVASEDTLRVLSAVHDTEFVIAVPHNIIGPGQRFTDPYRNVVSIFINRVKQGKPIIVYGDGTQRRLFSPIYDCIDSLAQMAIARVHGEVINIGPDEDVGEPMSILEIGKMVSTACGAPLRVRHMPGRPTEVKDAWCSSDKARKLLAYEPRMELYACIEEMVAAIEPAPFAYTFPLEITSDKCPETWSKRMM